MIPQVIGELRKPYKTTAIIDFGYKPEDNTLDMPISPTMIIEDNAIYTADIDRFCNEVLTPQSFQTKTPIFILIGLIYKSSLYFLDSYPNLQLV